MSIHNKLLGVMGEIDSISKRGRNEKQGYRYLMAEDVFEEVRPLFVRFGLVILPACVGQTITEGQTKSGGSSFLTTTKLQYSIIDAETGERVDLPWEGQGADSGDKGIYKAYTGGLKTFLRQLLLISTDDDPENDGGKPLPQRKPLTPPASGTPLPPPNVQNLVDAAKKVFGEDKVVSTEPELREGGKLVVSESEHPNRNKATIAITKTVAIQADKAGLKLDTEKHRAASEFFKRQITSLFDIGDKPADYQPFLKHLTELTIKANGGN